MRANEGRKNAIKPMSMSNPPMFQCCHILTKVRTDAGGIFFDLLAELEIQDDGSEGRLVANYLGCQKESRRHFLICGPLVCSASSSSSVSS